MDNSSLRRILFSVERRRLGIVLKPSVVCSSACHQMAIRPMKVAHLASKALISSGKKTTPQIMSSSPHCVSVKWNTRSRSADVHLKVALAPSERKKTGARLLLLWRRSPLTFSFLLRMLLRGEFEQGLVQQQSQFALPVELYETLNRPSTSGQQKC